MAILYGKFLNIHSKERYFGHLGIISGKQLKRGPIPAHQSTYWNCNCLLLTSISSLSTRLRPYTRTLVQLQQDDKRIRSIEIIGNNELLLLVQPIAIPTDTAL